MARYGIVIDMRSCTGCKVCIAACAAENKTPFWNEKFRTHFEEQETGHFPDVQRLKLPRQCMHCDNSPCLSACPARATYRRSDGIIMIDYDRCIGCYLCFQVCPYNARYSYELEDVEKERALYGMLASHRVPHVDKSTLCAHRVEENLEPAYVAACPQQARIFGDLDRATSEVHKLVSTGRAMALNAASGSSPKVMYILP
jgi:sulfur reductase FeS subunit